MTTVVLDTNVLVSAMLSRNGNEALILRIARSGGFLVCVSQPILDEYEEVLRRPGFRIPPSSVDQLIADFKTRGRFVAPKIEITASPDEADNRFLECAESATADYLVTGNRKHFPKDWKATKIVNARELLEMTTF
jgi:putative PIN family toxin of toxin-antitoxin system